MRAYIKKHIGPMIGATVVAMIATSLLSHFYRLERITHPSCKHDETMECLYDGVHHPLSYYGYHFGAPFLFYGESAETWFEARRWNIPLENVRRFDPAALVLDALIHFAAVASIPYLLVRMRRRRPFAARTP